MRAKKALCRARGPSHKRTTRAGRQARASSRSAREPTSAALASLAGFLEIFWYSCLAISFACATGVARARARARCCVSCRRCARRGIARGLPNRSLSLSPRARGHAPRTTREESRTAATNARGRRRGSKIEGPPATTRERARGGRRARRPYTSVSSLQNDWARASAPELRPLMTPRILREQNLVIVEAVLSSDDDTHPRANGGHRPSRL